MYQKYIKKFFDILLAITFIPVLVLLTVGIGLMIKMDDKGPVFYLSKRLGKDGKIFKMYKFRTMVVDAPDWRTEDGSTYNEENDPRQTRVGRVLRRTSLDEVPQIINILKGEMSFVGPRPDTIDSYEGYTEEEKKRLDVLPGITGYSQALFRNSIGSKEKIKNDVYYAERISIRMDLWIVYKTALIILRKEKIHTVVPSQQIHINSR